MGWEIMTHKCWETKSGVKLILEEKKQQSQFAQHPNDSTAKPHSVGGYVYSKSS